MVMQFNGVSPNGWHLITKDGTIYAVLNAALKKTNWLPNHGSYVVLTVANDLYVTVDDRELAKELIAFVWPNIDKP